MILVFVPTLAWLLVQRLRIKAAVSQIRSSSLLVLLVSYYFSMAVVWKQYSLKAAVLQIRSSSILVLLLYYYFSMSYHSPLFFPLLISVFLPSFFLSFPLRLLFVLVKFGLILQQSFLNISAPCQNRYLIFSYIIM